MGDNPHAGHRILYFHWRAFIYRMSNGAVCIALTWGYSKWSMAHCWNYLLLVVPCFFWISQNFCRMNPNRADQTGHAGKLILIWGKTHTTQCWCYKIKTIYIYIYMFLYSSIWFAQFDLQDSGFFGPRSLEFQLRECSTRLESFSLPFPVTTVLNTVGGTTWKVLWI